jgi:hypothetical protein
MFFINLCIIQKVTISDIARKNEFDPTNVIQSLEHI